MQRGSHEFPSQTQGCTDAILSKMTFEQKLAGGEIKT